MWQGLYEELKDRGLLVVAVAFDSRGTASTREWIEAAKATYPCLIDVRHEVASLYGMTNVPMAAWVDEEGQIARPAETAGTTDAFRAMDRRTGALPEESRHALRRARAEYLDAVRDWVANGSRSRFVSRVERVPPGRARTADQARAEAHFALGVHLAHAGNRAAGLRHLDAARLLWPENWAIARQGWDLDQRGKAGGPEFWAAVDALGERPYYEAARLEGP